MSTRIQLRRGTAAQWTAANPILSEGETGLETDTGKTKTGDGVAAWSALKYRWPFDPSTVAITGGVIGGVPVAKIASSPTADVGALTEPWCITHRGAGGMLAPDSIVKSFELGITFGTGIVDGGDWYAISDGAVIDCHDTTVDRITDQTGNTTSLSASEAARIKIDCSTWYGGGWQDQYGLMTPAVLFPRLNGATCFAPEPKNIGAANYLASYLSNMGMQKACLVNSFADALLAPFPALGFPYLLRNLSSAEVSGLTPAQCAAWKALGINYLGFDQASSSTAQVQIAIDAGMKVMITTPVRQSEKSKWDGMNIAGYASDDPVYFMGRTSVYRRTTAPWMRGAYYHGQLNNENSNDPNKRGIVTTAGLQLLGTQYVNNYILMGWACPLANATGTYRITIPITFNALGADTTRFVGVWIGAATDAVYFDSGATGENGYQIWLRVNGSLNMTKKVAGVAGATQTQATAAISAGGTATIQIDVTPTGVTATRTDVGAPNSVSLTDSAHRGGYWHLGLASANNGINVTFGNVTIS